MRQKPSRSSNSHYSSDFIYQYHSYTSKNQNPSFKIQRDLPSSSSNIQNQNHEGDGPLNGYTHNLHQGQSINFHLIKKRPWSADEDQLLMDLIQKYGPSKWSFIAEQMVERIGKQCRERWHNHLNPMIKKDTWSDHEEWILYLGHKLFGNRWAEIAKFISGRTDNCIKNHWNSSMKKRMAEMTEKYRSIKKCIEASRDMLKRLTQTECILIQKLIDQENFAGPRRANRQRQRRARRELRMEQQSKPKKTSSKQAKIIIIPNQATKDKSKIEKILENQVQEIKDKTENRQLRQQAQKHVIIISEPKDSKPQIPSAIYASPLRQASPEVYVYPQQPSTKKKKVKIDMLSTPKKNIHSRLSQVTPVHDSDNKSRVENNRFTMTQTDWHTNEKVFESPSRLLNFNVCENLRLEDIVLFGEDN